MPDNSIGIHAVEVRFALIFFVTVYLFPGLVECILHLVRSDIGVNFYQIFDESVDLETIKMIGAEFPSLDSHEG